MSSNASYDHVLAFALEHPWALTEGMRAIVVGILAQRIAGESADPAVLTALVNRKNLPQPVRGGGVAVIPIYGVIAPRMNMLSEFSGGTTFEALSAQLAAAIENPDVKTIVFDVDSPGGNIAGATEFAHEVLDARNKKPIIACAQYLMASAAYWPMACATEIVAAPSAMVGAVGVYTIHDDVTEALKLKGITRTVIAAGKFKADGIGGGTLTDDAFAYMKALCTEAYTTFTADIAKGRGVTPAAVRNGFGEGRVVGAQAAVDLGMVDKVATLDATLARVTGAPVRRSLSASVKTATDVRASLDLPPLTDDRPVDQEPSAATSTHANVATQRAFEAALLAINI